MRTLKTIGIVGGAAVFFLAVPIAFAEGQLAASTTDAVLMQKQERARIDAMMQTKSAEPVRADKIRQVEATKVRAELKERMPEVNKKAGMLGLANATTTEKVRDAAKSAKERMEAAREEAKTRVEEQRHKAEQRLTEIRDKATQQKAQGIAKQFAQINKRWTDHFMEALERHEAILGKVQARADIAAASGKNIASTTASIQTAKTAIDAARTAVIAQAAKVYELNASTSTAITVPPTASTTTANGGQTALIQNLRTAFKSLHATLFKDLFALRDGPMLAARRAVQASVQSLIRIPGINNGGTATTTTATTTATTTGQ